MADNQINFMPYYVERNLEHIKQQYNWDCGIACILMILPIEERMYFIQNFKAICQDEGFNHSTWTIDLCYLLKRFNVTHRYYTITLGAHPGYKDNSYYENLMQKDELRINRKFLSASSDHICIKRESLKLDDIIYHLINHGPVIILINANLLTCDICKINKLTMELRSCFPWPVQYVGHYIVLCGYNSVKQKILYRNPTFRDRLCAISHHGLEISRKSYGTDEDVILIFQNEQHNRIIF